LPLVGPLALSARRRTPKVGVDTDLGVFHLTFVNADSLVNDANVNGTPIETRAYNVKVCMTFIVTHKVPYGHSGST